MPYPVILIDSATGSDTAASGAGPATALTGSAATSSADGLTVTLDGSPDLSGVATDGSAALHLIETVAGRRCWAKITAVDNGAKTVTVTPAVRVSIGAGDSIDWAIGGKLASVGSATCLKLWDNNGAAGDAMPGWTGEMQSGHAETVAGDASSRIILRRAGDTTDGPITLRGAAGAATKPVLTFTPNGTCLLLNAAHQHLRDFELRNNNATKTASIAVTQSGGVHVCEGLKIAHATDKFWKGIQITQNSGKLIRNCQIGHTASHGIETTALRGVAIIGNFIHDCGADGIAIVGEVFGCLVASNVIARCTSDGIAADMAFAVDRLLWVVGNVLHDNGGSGVLITGAVSGPLGIWNNTLTENGAYGINLSTATAVSLLAAGIYFAYNAFRNNTSGEMSTNIVDDASNVTLTADPYTNAAGDDFTLNNTAGGGAAAKDVGFPSSILGLASAWNVNIGVDQTEVASGAQFQLGM